MFQKYVAAGYPILAVKTHEPDRALNVLAHQVKEHYKCASWDVENGIRELAFTDTDVIPSTSKEHKAPPEAIRWLLAAGDNTILFAWNYHRFFVNQGNIGIVQALQNARDTWKSKAQVMVILCPDIEIPPELTKSIALVDFDLPDKEELAGILRKIAESAQIPVPEDVDIVLDVACGLTLFEAENAFALSYATKGKFDRAIIESEKLQAIRKSGLLEIYPAVPEDDLGGHELLRKYLHNRRKGFYTEGIPKPKGIMLCGPPGAGKSLTAKVAASILGFPLVRFDIASLKGSKVGESEARMRQALALIDAVSPCLVWLEELEKVLGGVQSSGKSDSGTTASMFGYLLTWLQESQKPKFLVATINDMDELLSISQGALLRRFDDIFFVDLPTPHERADILVIMNRRYHTNIPPAITDKMDGWSGAEIEKFVIASIYDGIDEAYANIRPVYHQNRANIEKAREWARGNARPANSTNGEIKTPARRKLAKKEEA